MKKFTLAVLLFCFIFNVSAEDKISAFPGAEGFGKYATGGRGGRVIQVTSLEDYKESEAPVEGSLRYALKDAGDDPVTIVFSVSGRIDLKERLKCGRSNMTIAGQTAPGDGICISGNNIYFSGNNLIIRYLRFRTGDEQETNASCVNIENAENVIVDHCSFSWSMEENMTVYDNKYTTVQWCIISEPLYQSFHSKGVRGYGTQWGGQFASYHHNLIAHAYSRAPRVNGSRTKNDVEVLNDYVNNVIYNWGKKNSVYGGESEVEGGYCHTNWVNNYYKPGPASPSGSYFAEAYHDTSKAVGYGKWYVSGNYFDDVSYAAVNADNHKGMNYKGGEENQRSDNHFEVEEVTTTTAAQAYIDVLAGAGATIPWYDAVDRRIIAEAKGEAEPVYTGSSGRKGIIDTQETVGGWPQYFYAVAATDTDKDGIPDEWETENNLDPNDPTDGALITESGYSNLELYLNSILPSQYPDTKINTYNENNPVEVYTNLSQKLLHLYSTHTVEKITVYNLNGTIVYSDVYKITPSVITLNSLPGGIYIIGFKLNNGKSAYNKIVL